MAMTRSSPLLLLLLILLASMRPSRAGSLISGKGNVTLEFKTKDSLKSGDDDGTEEGEEGTMIVDRPREEESVGPLGALYGEDVGVGPAEGIRCLLQRPRGDDGRNYCQYVSEAREKMRLDTNLVVVSYGNASADANKRLIRSASIYSYDLFDPKELEGEEEKGGSANYLRRALSKLNPAVEKDKIVLFLNGEFSLLAAGPKRIIEEFDLSGADVLTASISTFVGKDDTLKRNFPAIETGRRFMDATALVGKALPLYELLKEFPDEGDIQELIMKAIDKPALRKKYPIKVDHKCNLFQNLGGETGDIELRFIGKEAYLQNDKYRTVPVVIKADKTTRTLLNNYGSYLARAWNPEEGCRECWENMNSLEAVSDEELPIVTLVLSIQRPSPFFEEYLQAINSLIYPKKRINLFVHNSMEFHEEDIGFWFLKFKGEYKTTKFIPHTETSIKEWHSKNMALEETAKGDSEFVFFVDADARLDNPHTLKLLVEQNRRVLAPLLPRPGKTWSNFWGALTSDGFYARSGDYVEILQNDKRGLWNVPYIGNCMLIKKELAKNTYEKLPFIKNLMDPDMAFCENLRDMGVFMYVSNRVDFGHLVSSDAFNIYNKYPEMWQIIENRWDWERRYLHENYSQNLNESVKIQQPCPDVYWFPVFTERFAKEMIEIMENYGQWSDGSHTDKRLEGGYETVPTVDIHMNQVSYNDEWHEILRAYVQPLQLRVYEGYYNDVGPPRALMSFVVRYKPDEQPFLRPHHDTSTYTINVGLNRPGIDYKGGGCRFGRYNCSVVATRVGWMLMHPGRLTHLHEGLPVTAGTRYIIVTFVDP